MGFYWLFSIRFSGPTCGERSEEPPPLESVQGHYFILEPRVRDLKYRITIDKVRPGAKVAEDRAVKK